MYLIYNANTTQIKYCEENVKYFVLLFSKFSGHFKYSLDIFIDFSVEWNVSTVQKQHLTLSTTINIMIKLKF